MTLERAQPGAGASGFPECVSHRVEASGDLTLTAADVEAVAQRVVSLLREERPVVDAGPRLWTTARVASELGRSEEWVRDHREELGVVTTSGVRPRLMFDPAAVRRWATARDGVVRSEAQKPAPIVGDHGARRRRAGTGVDLLPIGEDRSAA